MVQRIPLGGKLGIDRVALVDDEDLEAVQGFAWYVDKPSKGPVLYARAESGGRLNRKSVRMHILLTGIKGIDHANGDGLDNQRANLRLATPSQQLMNTRKQRGRSSQFKGVSRDHRDGVWVAYIGHDAKRQWLGRYQDEVEAARAYDTAARVAYGEFARLNFPGS